VLFLGLLSPVVGSQLAENQAAPEGSDSNGQVFFAGSADTSVFEERFSKDHETGWCLYGGRNDSGYVVERVEWIGRYGESYRISFSCQVYDLRLLGEVHSHPGRSEPRLSLPDAFSRGRRIWSRVSGIAVKDGGELEVGFFREEDLRVPFDTYTEPVTE
jgi:hypothetical protein